MTAVHQDVPLHAPAAPAPAKVGMLCFLLSEGAFFGTLIVSYLYYLDEIRRSDPNPSVLELPLALVGTAFLLLSSFTVLRAEKALHGGGAFAGWWALTLLLGVAFLGVTAREWVALVGEHGLTPQRNVFGSSYYTLVGFHALHVTVGVLLMLLVLITRRPAGAKGAGAAGLIAWYWHFVDGVWIIVFTVVYLVGR